MPKQNDAPALAHEPAQPAPLPDDATIREYIIRQRPRLKFAIDDEDYPPAFLQTPIGSPVGQRLRQMVDDDVPIRTILKRWPGIKRDVAQLAAEESSESA